MRFFSASKDVMASGAGVSYFSLSSSVERREAEGTAEWVAIEEAAVRWFEWASSFASRLLVGRMR